MPGVAMTVETLADEIRRHMWSGEQYRHFELGMLVRNDGPEAAEEVSYEICLSETLILDFNGDRWKPSHRHEIDGVVYVVWSSLGGHPVAHGVTMPPNAWDQWRDKLTVNVKPYVPTTSILYRTFERDDPLTDWLKTELTFKPFAPQL
jgi:hypothetical protein